MPHDPKMIERLRALLDKFLDEEATEKSQPGSSSVHVSVPLGGGKKRLQRSGITDNSVGSVTMSDEGRRVATIALKSGKSILMGKRRDNGKWTVPGGHVDPKETMHEGALRELLEETGIKVDKLDELTDLHKKQDFEGKPLDVQAFYKEFTDRPATSMKEDPDSEVERWKWVDVTDGLPSDIAGNLHVPPERNILMSALGLVSKSQDIEIAMKALGTARHRPMWQRILDFVCKDTHREKDSDKQVIDIFKADSQKQIVYGVVLEPHSVDSQDDWMKPEDIEKAAHGYLIKSREVGKQHVGKMDAEVVESYIAPQDMMLEGQYGSQVVKQGSWVLGVKVNDQSEWSKVVSGHYTGFSVGGFGLRS